VQQAFIWRPYRCGTWMGSTPVPSPTLGAARETAPSTLNASMPVTPATQNESYPRRSARRARSTAAAGPERMNSAAAMPRQLPPAGAAGGRPAVRIA
jgi:hypothetical protein